MEVEKLAQKFDQLLTRIEKIEVSLYGRNRSVSPPSSATETEPFAAPLPSSPTKTQSDDDVLTKESAPSDTSRFLGIIGIICFVLAAAFLVKLAIDSGWLTPERQILGAAIFGLSLVFVGLKLSAHDRSYFSLLPAAGVIILYLTVAAGNRLYDLYSAQVTVALTSLVSVLSVFLFARFRTEAFVAVATIGTYLSVFLLPRQFDPALFTAYFILWDVTFAVLSILLESRAMILLASYLSLGVFQWTIERPWLSPTENVPLVIGVQAIQFIIFSVSLVFYAIRNKVLTGREAWAFFPVLVFFYGIEYSLLNRVYPELAPWIALGFGAFVYFLYSAAKRVQNDSLDSAAMIYAFLSIVLFHALYLEILPSAAQIWIGPALIVFLALISRHLRTHHWCIYALVGLIGTISYIRCLSADTSISWNELIGLNLLFGTLFLLGYGKNLGRVAQDDGGAKVERETRAILCLGFAHIQLLVGTYRLLGQLTSSLELSQDLRPFLTSSGWGVLGIGILLWAKARRDATLARSALIILLVACAKLFLYDVAVAAPLIRVFCFLATGTVLYLSGYILRRVNQWKR